MKLYYFETPNARKPCAVAKHLQSPVEFIRVDLTRSEHKQPEYLAINPNGRVPALQDGDFRLWESHAIMCHLARKADSDLWPTDEREQVDILRWLNWDTAHFSRHASRLFFQRAVKPAFGLGAPDANEIEDATGFFNMFARVLNEHLQGRNTIACDRLTVADFAVGSVLPYAEDAELPLEPYPEIRRWHEGLMALPAWRDPFPQAQAEPRRAAS
jgi:glutathione S-transferase